MRVTRTIVMQQTQKLRLGAEQATCQGQAWQELCGGALHNTCDEAELYWANHTQRRQQQALCKLYVLQQQRRSFLQRRKSFLSRQLPLCSDWRCRLSHPGCLGPLP